MSKRKKSAKAKALSFFCPVIGMKDVQWRSLKWLQGSLKEVSPESMKKLKESIRVNGFVMPFHVWDDVGADVWILDGHHRKRAMEELEKEGMLLPAKLPATFIACTDKQHALKMVLVYSAVYAYSTDESLHTFLVDNNLLEEFGRLKLQIDLPHIDLSQFETAMLGSGFAPGSITDQPRLDQRNPVTCPKCGHEFTPQG